MGAHDNKSERWKLNFRTALKPMFKILGSGVIANALTKKGFSKVAPPTASLSAWEQTYQQLETDDPHKIAVAPECKGSTKSNFFDDRTIIILKYR